MQYQKRYLIIGIILICLGLLYLGSNLNLWEFTIFFNGWWTLFIIVPSVISLIKKENMVISSLGTIIGILFLMAERDYLSWGIIGKLLFPLILVSIGIYLVFKPKLNFVKKANGEVPNFIGVFSGCEEKINDKFKGATCIAVFGGVDLDLTNAEIKEDIIIDCVAIFGGIDIKLPENINLKSEGISILGGASNKYLYKEKSKNPTVYINHVSIFGGTDLK